MMNRMKWFAGVAVLMMTVACGPMEPREETGPGSDQVPATDATVQAEGVNEFIACVGYLGDAALACANVCVVDAPTASIVPCLVSCNLDLATLTRVLGCVSALEQ